MSTTFPFSLSQFYIYPYDAVKLSIVNKSNSNALYIFFISFFFCLLFSNHNWNLKMIFAFRIICRGVRNKMNACACSAHTCARALVREHIHGLYAFDANASMKRWNLWIRKYLICYWECLLFFSFTALAVLI